VTGIITTLFISHFYVISKDFSIHFVSSIFGSLRYWWKSTNKESSSRLPLYGHPIFAVLVVVIIMRTYHIG
jgi:hypothetical protein